MTPLKDTNKLPATDPKEMRIYKLPNKEFKIIIRKALNEIQDRQQNKIRKTMHE